METAPTKSGGKRPPEEQQDRCRCASARSLCCHIEEAVSKRAPRLSARCRHATLRREVRRWDPASSPTAKDALFRLDSAPPFHGV